MDERLTSRNPDGGIAVRDLPAALEKLASYEDAEEQGRLVRLPCKPGDVIYSRWDWCVPKKTHKRGEVYVGEYAIYRTGLMLNNEGAITPFVEFGNDGIHYTKPLNEALEKCSLTLDGAFQERKAERVGEWRESGDGFFDFCYCSRCGHKERRETRLPSLCPSCGARMAK